MNALPHTPSPPLAFTAPLRAMLRNARRLLTRRHLFYALLAGAGLGAAEGIGAAIWQRGPFVNQFLAMLIPQIVQALLLLVSLAFAASVRPSRMPKWLPFVIGATLATLVACMFDGLVVAPIAFGMTEITFSAIWFNVPTYLTIGILVGLAYMHGVDASRRTGALRNLQLEHTRVARQAYESRLQTLRARVDPTFLFETLGIVEAHYASSRRKGEALLDALIVYLRAALPSLDEDASSLSAELTLARTWLEITRILRSERLTFTIDAPQPMPEISMPAMVLMPVVQQMAESAAVFAHGVMDVTIAAALSDEQVRIVIAAAGSNSPLNGDEASFVSVRERLKAVYGTNAQLTFRVVEYNRNEAVLEIPLERSHRDHR